jgi:hypothetical protein
VFVTGRITERLHPVLAQIENTDALPVRAIESIPDDSREGHLCPVRVDCEVSGFDQPPDTGPPDLGHPSVDVVERW